MEATPSSLASLLTALRVDGPWTPPATWESILTESGATCPAVASDRPRRDLIYELASVPDAGLARLSLHALYGVKSSLVEIEGLSMSFSSSPADRTSHRVANVWSRSSSATALGQILKSIGCVGLAVFFLCKFVHFYLFPGREKNYGGREKGHEDEVSHDKDAGQNPPYGLVNQAFAVAVEKVLEGYFCSLNTLPASIKLRRSVGQADVPSMIPDGASHNTSSEVTILEVYLHTEELRRHIKSLANICFPKFAGLALCQEGLTTDTNLEFENFPRGADLLSYLYVHLRDADPVHYGLLKYLFVRSCEPYCNFIKSWIYRACVDDPYEEFLIAHTENKQTQDSGFGSLHDFSLLPLKGRNHVSAPCFLKDICHPLLQTGQQLQVLMKLLKLCNLSITGGGAYVSRNIMNLEAILPWFDMSIDSSLNSLNFTKDKVEALVYRRDVIYKSMMEKLHYFFSQVEVIPFDTTPSSLCGSMSTPDGAVSGGKMFSVDTNTLPALSVDTNALPVGNMCIDKKDNDASSTSCESSDRVDSLEFSDCSSSYCSTEEIEAEDVTACDNLSSSMFSSYYATGAKCSSVTGKLDSSQTTCSVSNRVYPASPIDEHHKDNNLRCTCVPVHSWNKEHNELPDALELDYQFSKFWPFDELLKNPLSSSSSSPGKQVSHDNVISPFCCKSEPSGTWNSKNKHESVSTKQSWGTNGHYNLSFNPILRNAACQHMKSDLQVKRNNQGFTSFDFESVTNPFDVYSGWRISCLDDEFEVEAPMLVQSTVQAFKQADSSNDLCQAKAGSQACIATSREMAARDSLQENASGGAFWARSLEYTGKSMESTAGDDSLPAEMPIDIIIDKCIVQEVLLQYKYVSSFTIKLLEEGFDFCGHLLALRRYHFMEQADWADSFVVSVFHKKWSFIKSEQKRAEIQGLLDLALQRSSCDSDTYKERLFVCMKEKPVVPLAASACGLDVLDGIMLGYKVDWPVNIIITEHSRKVYGEIFCYLVQVRFAVFSLTEVWRFLKELMQLASCPRYSRPDILKDLNSVIKVRHQVYHFLSTLQQCLHCQLSDISWHRFQHSLRHQVRDMRDLEYAHLSYVTDALHICFLSNETKPIASIIKNMLQCALELQLCFKSLDVIGESAMDELNLHSLINFSQVDAIRTKFESNIKDLYILHSKSSKYSELALSHFWGYLNYNEYYSSTMSKDIGCFYF